MKGEALGVIEMIGMAAAVEAADTCVKSSNVKLVGYELTKGEGMVTIKILGEVGSVKAAIDAAKFSAGRVNNVVSTLIIPRPCKSLGSMVSSKYTVGIEETSNKELVPDVIDEKQELCNLCLDPKCPRVKGQPRNLCIHHKE